VKFEVHRQHRNFIIFILAASVIIGIATILAGAYLNAADTVNFKETAIETTATITDIHTSSQGGNRHVYVAFHADSREYRGELDYHRSNMYEGEKIQILYAPDNPRNFRSIEQDGKSNTTSAICGLVLLLLGGTGLASVSRRYALKKRLLQDGNKVMAEFLKLKHGNTSVNEEKSLVLICEYKNKTDSVVYTFKSEEFWIANHPPGKELKGLDGALVPVYVKKDDYSKYYVDIDSFFNALGNRDSRHQEDQNSDTNRLSG